MSKILEDQWTVMIGVRSAKFLKLRIDAEFHRMMESERSIPRISAYFRERVSDICGYRRIYIGISKCRQVCAAREHSIIRGRARVVARRGPSTPVRAQTWLATQPSFFDRPVNRFSLFVPHPDTSTVLSTVRCVNLSRARDIVLHAGVSRYVIRSAVGIAKPRLFDRVGKCLPR